MNILSAIDKAGDIASVVPSDLGDSLFVMWAMAWGAEAFLGMAAGTLSFADLWNGNFFHPSTLVLTFSEHLVAIMSGVGIKRIWNSEGSPWYNFFDEIELTAFSPEEATFLVAMISGCGTHGCVPWSFSGSRVRSRLASERVSFAVGGACGVGSMTSRKACTPATTSR